LYHPIIGWCEEVLIYGGSALNPPMIVLKGLRNARLSMPRCGPLRFARNDETAFSDATN
jgi:hypothetical protein